MRLGMAGLVSMFLLGLAALACTSPVGDHVVQKFLAPQAVMLLPEGNDPRIVDVGVKWTEAGWCLGQFHVQSIKEVANDVWLGQVIDDENPNAVCAGVGTLNNMAWAELKLGAPLGTRRPIRASDGAILPILPANTQP